jgi:hypothetical protein
MVYCNYFVELSKFLFKNCGPEGIDMFDAKTDGNII